LTLYIRDFFTSRFDLKKEKERKKEKDVSAVILPKIIISSNQTQYTTNKNNTILYE